MPFSNEQLSVFPAFFRVEGRIAAVFGNGDEAFAKVRLLLNTRARIVAYADHPEADYHSFLISNRIETVRVAFSPEQVDGATLVFAATGNAAEDRAVVEAARAVRVPANAVDQPDYCDFFTPALVNRAPVAVAIGTEGAGPVLAQMIRAQVDQLLSPSLGRLADLATSYRKTVEHLVPRGVARRVFWRRFFSGRVARRRCKRQSSRSAACRKWPPALGGKG